MIVEANCTKQMSSPEPHRQPFSFAGKEDQIRVDSIGTCRATKKECGLCPLNTLGIVILIHVSNKGKDRFLVQPLPPNTQ